MQSAVRLFYIDIEITGTENIQKGKPYIILANHQNTLIDALLIVCFVPIQNIYFLARADIFHVKEKLTKLLQFLRIAPIYRPSDKKEIRQSNQGTWEHTSKILNQGDAICIFPEGTHKCAWEHRPLKNGYKLIAQKSDVKDLSFLPVMLHYEKHDSGLSKVWIEICDPIDAEAENKEEQVKEVFTSKMLHSENQEELKTQIQQGLKKESELSRVFTSIREKGNTESLSDRNALSKIAASLLLIIAFPLFVLASLFAWPLDYLINYAAKKIIKDESFAISLQLVFKWLFFSIFSLIYLITGLLTKPIWYLAFIPIIGGILLFRFQKMYLYRYKTFWKK